MTDPRSEVEVIREALSYPQAWLYPNAEPTVFAERKDALAALASLEARLNEAKEALTGAKFENIAWALDRLTELTRCLLEPLASMDDLNAASIEVGVELTTNDRPMTSEDAKKLLEWVSGTEMQDDLRRLASITDPEGGDK